MAGLGLRAKRAEWCSPSIYYLQSAIRNSQAFATPWPTPTRLVPPSPTPRAALATPMGASNLDAIINEGTLTLGWVGPALLGILIAAFGWAGRVLEWMGTLASWLFSGEWRDSGPVER